MGERGFSLHVAAGPVDDHMGGHGEQPGPAPGGSTERSENLQGGVPEKGHRGGPAYRGGPEEGLRANRASYRF